MIRRPAALLLALLAALAASPPAAQAAGEFGFNGEGSAAALNRNGTVNAQAGAHPYAFTVHFGLRTEGGKSQGGEMRDVIVDLPPGLVGDPLAVPRCPRKSFEGGTPDCPASTQVGILHAIIPSIGEAVGPVYNLEPPPGIAAQLGFSEDELVALQGATVQAEEEPGRPSYAARVFAPNLPLEVVSVTETIWGLPADPAHTPERGLHGGVASEAPLLPFLTMPTYCTVAPQLTIRADSVQNPGAYVSETVPLRAEGGQAAPLSGCEAVPFSPQVTSTPSTAAAESPAGLGFELQLPNQGLLDPNAIAAETEPEKTVVTLPAGITANPAAATGLSACSEQQFKEASLAPGSGCPESSKLGTLVAQTPLLEEAIEGSVYLATPHQNRFGSLLALYIVARAGERGVLVKQAGEVRADPSTGQLTTTFDGLPPLPYSSFELRLREGPRAPLITPQLCGTYATTAELYPFSAPEAPAQRTAPFTISSGAEGAPCAASESQLPNHPTLEAGTLVPSGGTYSPFVFRLSRSDGSQRFGSLTTTLPEGLTGRLAGIPYCSEQALAAASSRGFEGGGAAELAQPSCPAASQVGTVSVGAGAGPQPFYAQGKVYLAGPYKGAPLSLAIITPALAGPFDLGSILVRAAVYVDEFSAQITVKSDPLPTILHGIPTDVRSVSVRMQRPDFTLNPTDCKQMAISGSLTSTAGRSAALSEPFQAIGCKGLEFAPKLALSLKGPTRRSGHPALKAVVTYPKGGPYANVARAQVGLPHSEFLDQGNLNKVCTQPELRSRSCPKTSVYGHAKAWSPLLEKPLQGPVYLGVGFGYKLPALVAELNGQVRILLKGKTDTTKHEGLRNTFEAVPDAPVSRFVLELKGGKKYGLLENSENICRKPQRASVLFNAQNGKALHSQPTIANSCGKGAKKKKKKGAKPKRG